MIWNIQDRSEEFQSVVSQFLLPNLYMGSTSGCIYLLLSKISGFPETHRTHANYATGTESWSLV